MYSNLELAIIVGNCKTIEELLLVCQVFRWLITTNDLSKSKLLQKITNSRFRELEKLDL